MAKSGEEESKDKTVTFRPLRSGIYCIFAFYTRRGHVSHTYLKLSEVYKVEELQTRKRVDLFLDLTYF